MELFEPLVSIVIPVYNGSNYLREAIESSLNQTYKKIEIIVVNDGSTDNGQTREIANAYGERIRYFEKDNGGCATALNFGIDQMRGEYFSWLSHDDKYLPEKIESQINILRTLNNKSTVIYGGFEVIDAESNKLSTVCPESVLPQDKLNNSLLPLLRGLVHGCSLLIPSDAFIEVGKFDPSLRSTQDYALWFDLFRVRPIRFQEGLFVQSRVHPDRGTHKIDNHINECNSLWCGFLRRLTVKEMEGMEGSEYLFLSRTATFLKQQTPYKDAEELATIMAVRALENIFVSVVIPFHNRISWVIRALQSVQEQTHQNLEIILVDDGSTEDGSVLEAYIASDKRIRYARQDKVGLVLAKKHGISIANGKYIAFLDSDFIFEPQKLTTQLRFMEDYGYKISHTSFLTIDLEGNVLGEIQSGRFSGKVFPQIISSCPIAAATVMVDANIVKNSSFLGVHDISEEVGLWVILSEIYELGGIEQCLSRARIGPSTSTDNSERQVVELLSIAVFALRHPSMRMYINSILNCVRTVERILSTKVEGKGSHQVQDSSSQLGIVELDAMDTRHAYENALSEREEELGRRAVELQQREEELGRHAFELQHREEQLGLRTDHLQQFQEQLDLRKGHLQQLQEQLDLRKGHLQQFQEQLAVRETECLLMSAQLEERISRFETSRSVRILRKIGLFHR